MFNKHFTDKARDFVFLLQYARENNFSDNDIIEAYTSLKARGLRSISADQIKAMMYTNNEPQGMPDEPIYLDESYKSGSALIEDGAMKLAGFPELKYLQELVREELPKDAQTALPELETLQFIKEGRNIVFCGNPGTGKTHISIGLGIKACLEGYTVFFTSVPRLLTQIRECRSQKSLRLLELRFQNYDMVICDEFGYVSCDKEGGELLFNHLSLRASKKSTIITTNLAFDRWGEIVKDKVLVAAMVDRLTHKAYLINMNGQSCRVKETKKILQSNAE